VAKAGSQALGFYVVENAFEITQRYGKLWVLAEVTFPPQEPIPNKE
jgi:hypothetical protein